MMNQRIGIIGGTLGPMRFAEAARSIAGVEPLDVNPERLTSDIDIVAVDVPLEDRREMVASIGRSGFAGPLIVEAPLAVSTDELHRIERDNDGLDIWSVNPLRYQVHTRRILDIVAGEDDHVTALFAAWRATPAAFRPGIIIQLLDYVSQVAGSIPTSVEAVNRSDPNVMLGLARMQSGIVAHLELGEHLPVNHPQPEELFVEVFRRESALHVDAFRQAVTVQTAGDTQQVLWTPDVSRAVLADILKRISDGEGPDRSLADDSALLWLLPRDALSTLGNRTPSLGME